MDGRRSSDHVFVVRTWSESPHGSQRMRGQVDHPASGARRYFSNFGELCDFIGAVQSLRRVEHDPTGAAESGDEAGGRTGDGRSLG